LPREEVHVTCVGRKAIVSSEASYFWWDCMRAQNRIYRPLLWGITIVMRLSLYY